MRRAAITATLLTLLIGLSGCTADSGGVRSSFNPGGDVFESRVAESEAQRAKAVDAACEEFQWDVSRPDEENRDQLRDVVSQYEYTTSLDILITMIETQCPSQMAGLSPDSWVDEPPREQSRDERREQRRDDAERQDGGSDEYSDDTSDLTDGCMGEREMYYEMADEGMWSQEDLDGALAELEMLGC